MKKYVFLGLSLVQGVMSMPLSVVNPELALVQSMQQTSRVQPPQPSEIPLQDVEGMVTVPLDEHVVDMSLVAQQRSSSRVARGARWYEDFAHRERTMVTTVLLSGALVIVFCVMIGIIPVVSVVTAMKGSR